MIASAQTTSEPTLSMTQQQMLASLKLNPAQMQFLMQLGNNNSSSDQKISPTDFMNDSTLSELYQV